VRLRRRHRPSGHDINCQQAVFTRGRLPDGALTAAERDRLGTLDECPHCSRTPQQDRNHILVAGEIRAEDLTRSPART